MLFSKLLAFALMGFVLSSPIYNVSSLAYDEEDVDVFDPTPPNQRTKQKIRLEVNNLQEIATRYGHIVGEKTDSSSYYFFIRESNTILTRGYEKTEKERQEEEAMKSNPPIDLDDPEFDFESTKRSSITNRGWSAGKDKEKGNSENDDEEDDEKTRINGEEFKGKVYEDTDWVEFYVRNPKPYDYKGLVPVSSCQSQKFGKAGSITFGFGHSSAFSNNYNVNAALNIGIKIPMPQPPETERVPDPPSIPAFSLGTISLTLNVELELVTTRTISGSATCNLKPGQTGQILMRPMYASVEPRSRRVRWSQIATEFMALDEFKTYDRIMLVVDNGVSQVYCATADVVPLFCHNRIGEPNFRNPDGVGYEDKLSNGGEPLLTILSN